MAQVPHLSNQALEGETMNKFAVWFGRLVWLGIVANLVLAIPGLLWPEQVLTFLGFPPASPSLWPSFACLLLILLSLFYVPGAINPFHYRANAYLAVFSRLVGFAFFIAGPSTYYLLGLFDLAFAIPQGILLLLALKMAK
jgi:hypothetical protein